MIDSLVGYAKSIENSSYARNSGIGDLACRTCSNAHDDCDQEFDISDSKEEYDEIGM